MGMHHDHWHDHHDTSTKNIGVALALNFSFAIIELIGGFLTGSVAILADALHDFGDSLSLGMALLLERMAKKKHDRDFSYGYRRLSLLSAFITGLVLIGGSVAVLYHAIPRLFNPVQPVAEGMIGLAFLGIAVNGYAAWRVMQGETQNEKTISWHMIEDLLGWVVVLVGSVVMYFWDVPILDPIMSICFTIFILVGVARPFITTSKLFLQATPKGLELDSLKAKILTVQDVEGLHDVHVWSLDGASHVMTMHAVVKDNISISRVVEVKDEIRKIVGDFGAFHVTLEIETASEECPDIHCGDH